MKKIRYELVWYRCENNSCNNKFNYPSIQLLVYCYIVKISHLSPGERGYGNTGMLRVLNVTMLRGLSHTIKEVDSRKVSVGDF